MKKIKIFLALVGATLLSANALAEEPDYDANGFATDESNPNQYQEPTKIDGVYQIANAGNLYWFANYVNQLGVNLKANAILANDIVVNTLEFKDGEIVTDGKNYRVWTPIGNYNKSFQGTFDGNGKTISGLYYDNSYQNYVGLFGNNQGTIKNVGVVDSYFNGQAGIGGVCGYNENGTIENCYNTGEFSGNNEVGGVCGYNENGTIENCYNTGEFSGGEYSCNVGGVCGDNYYGTITNCYNTGEVSGNSEVGGVCGYNYGTITNCYNTGEVSGYTEVGGVCGYNENGTIENCYNTGKVSGSQYFGGVCGDNYNGTITNCYYLSDTDNGKDAKTKEQFNNGFVAYKLSQGKNGDVWGQDLSNSNSLPTLYGSKVYYDETNNKYVNSDNGFLADNKYEEPRKYNNDVYLIANAGNLYWFAQYVNKGGENLYANAILMNNIVVKNTNKTFQWTPIGISYDNSYKGTFDGNGKTISKLYFDNSDQDYVGLFGYNEGTIKNVGVVGSYFNGGFYVGGVCGYNNAGTITNCYNTGVVSGSLHIGGVCGYNYEYNSTIENCYNTGEVSGLQNIGGVSGYNNYGDITNCYTTGKVSGEDKVGGVCGENYYGTITNCYNTGEVSGSKYIGGVCGENNIGTITNCYYLSDADNENDAKTKEQFNNGFVAYLLSQGDNGGVWGQDLSNPNALPMLNGSKVYKNICEDVLLGYSNEDKSYEEHEYENGICKHCGLYQQADINTDGYYEIANAGNLYWFAQYVNQVDENFTANAILTDDIVVNTDVLVDGKLKPNKTFREWIPIGNDDNPYKGTFDGNGKTISGLYFDNSNQNLVGLFGYNEGTIKNVGLVESYFNGQAGIGGVCGLNNGTITNCYNTDKVSGSQYIGGVCGYNDNQGTITNCYNTGEVSGNSEVGGVCGFNVVTITNCYNTGVVSGGEESGSIGGVSGYNYGTITNCYYLETSANTGIGEGDGEATAKTATQFADGTVAKLLFASDTIWGQNTSTDTVPNFSGKILFKVTLTAENGTAENGLGEYNKKYEIKATANTGYHFAGWSNGSTEIKDSILVVNDTALVATFEAHSFGNWDTTLVATCTVAGLRTHACACGEVEIDTIPALGHKIVVDSAVAATCTKSGLTEGKHCSVCGSVLVAQQTVAKIAHTVVVDSAKTATCTVAGLTEGKHCSVCDSVLLAQQTVPALGHKIVVDSAKIATCTATGLTEGSHCSVCDSILVAQQTVPALGHKVETLAGVSPTCTAEGLTEGSRCSVCGEVIKAQQTIPVLGHSFTNYIYNNDATYEADGTETAVCDHGCGATDTRTAEGTKLTDIDATETAEVAIYAHHNVIVVENAEADIYVYDATGRCIEMRESCPSVEIAMQREGIYIVRTGGKTQRVFVAQN